MPLPLGQAALEASVVEAAVAPVDVVAVGQDIPVAGDDEEGEEEHGIRTGAAEHDGHHTEEVAVHRGAVDDAAVAGVVHRSNCCWEAWQHWSEAAEVEERYYEAAAAEGVQ